jgi:hypothetical protein
MPAPWTSPADWSLASSGTLANADAIEFPEASSAWGTVTHFGPVRCRLRGNLLAHGALAQAKKTIGSGDSARFAPGDLEIHLN